MSFLWRLRKKILKRWARNAFFPSWRVQLLRWCGFEIGRNVYIADDFMVVEELADRGGLVIGDRVSVAPRVTMVTSSHPNNSLIREFAPVQRGTIVIEDDAWLGVGVTVLPGVRIGRGAVIGAHSVVHKDVAPLQVVAGRPAANVRSLDAPPGWL